MPNDPRRRVRPVAGRWPRHRSGARPRRLTSRATAFGAWRRRLLARLPVGSTLVVAAALLALGSLRTPPPEATLDPTSVAPVVVATVELTSGTVVGTDDIEVRHLPRAAIPPAAVTDARAAVGRQVTATILPGEPVATARLAPEGRTGLAAATPAGWSAFSLPTDLDLPATTIGQAVDLYALGATSSVIAPDARRVARGARVVAVEDHHISVAVADADASAVAAALIGSSVVVAVTGPDDPTGTDPPQPAVSAGEP